MGIILNKVTEEKEIIETKPKYKLNDKVIYIDFRKVNRIGNIIEVIKTDVYEWNKNEKQRYMYLLNNSPYYRYEEEILKICKNN